MIARVEGPNRTFWVGKDENEVPPEAAGQDIVPGIHGLQNSPATEKGDRGSESPTRPLIAPRESDPVTSQNMNSVVDVNEIPHSAETQTSEPGPSRSVSQSNQYLKTGPGTRCPAGLAAGG